MNLGVAIAATLVIVGALYIRRRWRRSPQAYRAMIALAACYFVAGSIAGAWILYLTTPKPIVPPTQVAAPSAAASPSTVAPMLKENYTGPSFPIPPLHYDPAHAVLPDPKLTPGDAFPGANADDICTPGWSREHRHVTEEMRDKVYAEYGRTRGPGCCEVDHLIPLELGGSNDMKNLWPQPDDPRPGDAEKDSLENDLHARVCKGEISLADAQKVSRRIGSGVGKNTWCPSTGQSGRRRIVTGGSEKCSSGHLWEVHIHEERAWNSLE